MMARAESIVRNAVEELLLHGMSKQELEGLMLRIFKKADADRCAFEGAWGMGHGARAWRVGHRAWAWSMGHGHGSSPPPICLD